MCEWSADGAHLAFVSTSRDHKDEWLRMADTATGEVRDVYHEHADTYYGWQSKVNWKYLPRSNEFLWVSERSNWAQIYLYDLTTGKLKNQITHGDGPVYRYAVCRPEEPRDLFHCGRQGEGRKSLLRTTLPRGLRRQEPEAADAGRCRTMWSRWRRMEARLWMSIPRCETPQTRCCATTMASC